MRTQFLKAAAAASILLYAIGGSAALAQVSPSQIEKDSNKTIPAAADASLAKDEANAARSQAIQARNAAAGPKAKAAAAAAAEAADLSALEANAAAKEASGVKLASSTR